MSHYEKKTKPCSLCGKLMVEDGDGWYGGEPGSAPGFYSSHWACVFEDTSGLFGVQTGAPLAPHTRWYNNAKRAEQVRADYVRWNPNYAGAFMLVTRTREEVK